MGVTPATRFAFIGADKTTRFEIGSITKCLTGMLLADAIQRGDMSLATEIGQVIPASAGTEFGSISMQELCTHTSGLPRRERSPWVFPRALALLLLGLDPYRGISASRVMKQASRQRLTHRGRHQYSNLGGAVLGQLLAIVIASDYPSLLRDRILAPVGMTSSDVTCRGSSASMGRSSLGFPRQPWRLDGYAPAGGVFSTIEDMARLAAALLDGSAPGIESMTPIDVGGADNANRAFGMCWGIALLPGTGRTLIAHSGGTGGYRSCLVLFPQAKRAAIVLGTAMRGPQQQDMAFGLIKSLCDSARDEAEMAEAIGRYLHR